MPAGSDEDEILAVVKMIKCVSRFRADAVDVSFAFERGDVFLVARKIVLGRLTGLAAALGMLFAEERYRDIEVRSQPEDGHAGFGQHRVAQIEGQRLFCIVRPGARVQVEYQMIPSVVPVREARQFGGQIVDELGRQWISIEGVQGEDEYARSSRIGRVVSRLGYHVQDLLVERTYRVLNRINVNREALLALREVEARFHSTFPPWLCDRRVAVRSSQILLVELLGHAQERRQPLVRQLPLSVLGFDF